MARAYYKGTDKKLHPLNAMVARAPGGAAAGYIVTVTGESGGFKADHTSTEIAAAELAGQIIELRYKADRYQFDGMLGEGPGLAAQFTRINVSSDDVVQVTAIVYTSGYVRVENSIYGQSAVLLWTNPDPDGIMTAGDTMLNTQDCRLFFVTSRFTGGAVIPLDVTGNLSTNSGTKNIQIRNRLFTISVNKMTVLDCWTQELTEGSKFTFGVSNKFCIPYQIYGIR